MTRAKTPPRIIPGRRTAETFERDGRKLARGTELRVDGLRGRVAFVQHVAYDDGREWLEVVTTAGSFRAVRPDAISRVHRNITGILAIHTARKER